MDNANANVPKITKWPFFLGDAVLLGFAGYAIYLDTRPLGLVMAAALAAIGGAWLAAYPYVLQYRALVRLLEADALQSCTDRLSNLDQVTQRIDGATEQWQNIRLEADKVVQLAQSVASQMTAEAQSFTTFLEKAAETDKSHLRLEIEKLRRAQNDFLHVDVAILDHVFALHQAGMRSGQPNLVQQLGLFQNACRDAARRIGLIAYAPNPGDPFDAQAHHLEEAGITPGPEARVSLALAPGYSFQGQLLRPALVRLDAPASEIPETTASAGVPSEGGEVPPPRAQGSPEQQLF
jgi:molecular chaperone GrpE (heat shock protein)